MTAGDLYVVVRDLVSTPGARPIATSADVKRELTARGIEWDRLGRSGGALEAADRQVLKDGRLQRWKHGHGPNDELGWSLSRQKNPDQNELARQYAEAHGWHPSIKF